MSFKKQQSGGLIGLLIKHILCGNDFQKEFSFLKKDQIIKTVEYGAELWVILKKMLQTAVNRSQIKREEGGFQDQFDVAHKIFVKKLQEHKNRDMFAGAIKILDPSQKDFADGQSSH